MSGIISVPIILVYIFICYLIYKLLIKDIESKTLAKVIFTLILTFPFWDLIVQKGIKTIYQFSGALEAKIYEMPEMDENGMIESFSSGAWNSIWTEKNVKHIYGKLLKKKIKYIDFILIKKENKIYRFYLKNGEVKSKIIPKESARYSFQLGESKEKLFGLYAIQEKGVYDHKKKKFIAKSFFWCPIKQFEFFEYIRKKILFLKSASGSGAAMVGVGCSSASMDKMNKEIFGTTKIYGIGRK